MVERYVGYEEIRECLEKSITPETVFVCVGSSKVTFDIFGPMLGQLLKERNIPHYGDYSYNVNAVTMYDRLYEIYETDERDNQNIIAIDAAVTMYEREKNEVIMKDGIGVKPGAGLGRLFPIIGTKSILMFTMYKDEIDSTMKGYKKGLYFGRRKDPSDKELIIEKATILADMIAEIYNKVCSNSTCV